ncbi:MAG: G8 domain-containing protein [Planctomycetota bacterium]
MPGGTSLAHRNSPALKLVPLEEATHTVSSSGKWSDPEVWTNGELPSQGARIVVPAGITLQVDSVISESFKTIRVDGKLTFATKRDTELRVDTLVTTMTGELVIGSECDPIRPNVTAKVVFADDGAIDRNWDPSIISRGALLHGKTTIHGAQKAAFLTLVGDTTAGAQPATQGATQITLGEPPKGWRVGDTISIAGIDPNDPASDEVVTISSINGVTVGFDTPLARDHIAPRAGLEVHVANMTRNVQFSSENTAAEHRAHVMFMHNNDVDARYVSFHGMGRTDKGMGVNDWELISGSEESIGSENTEVRDLGGFNVRGRYSVHFHRGGASGKPALVQGAVVRDDPGWAYVNHSSNVNFLDNVSHNVVGSAYNTEAGDEIGSFIRNIAIRTVNPDANLNPADEEIDPGQEPDARVDRQDFGWQGDGFWFHGSGVTVDDNVVSGATGHAYIYWMLGLVEKGLGENLVDVGNLPNGDLIGEPGTLVRTKQVPVPSFAGNSAYAASKGLNLYYLHTDNRDDSDEHFVAEELLADVPQEYEDQLQSTFSNFIAWNVPLVGIDAPYAGRVTFESVELVGTGMEGSVGIKLDQFANQNDITVRNIMVDGYLTGIAAQRQGQALIDTAEISALTDIRINAPNSDARNLEINNVEFLPLSDLFDQGEERVNISLDASFDLGLGGGLFGIDEFFFDEETLFDVPPMFQRDRIVLNSPGYENVGLFFEPQSADFVPVPEGSELAGFVDSELVDLTNAQLQDQFEISFSDAVTPTGASFAPIVDGGMVGDPLPQFDCLPPADDTYWVNFLTELDVYVPPNSQCGGESAGDLINGYHNLGNPTDINADGMTSPLDGLAIINYLSEYEAGPIRDSVGLIPNYVDVNNDGQVSPTDALLVINALQANIGQVNNIALVTRDVDDSLLDEEDGEVISWQPLNFWGDNDDA